MTKIIAVLGATGQQGGGVVNILSKTPGWKVRAITRNTSGDKAKQLEASGVEVVQGNPDDEASLVKAFEVSTPPIQTPHISQTKIYLGRQCNLRGNQLLGALVHRKISSRIRRD